MHWQLLEAMRLRHYDIERRAGKLILLAPFSVKI